MPDPPDESVTTRRHWLAGVVQSALQLVRAMTGLAESQVKIDTTLLGGSLRPKF